MNERTITVVGVGRAVGAPDIARADLGVRVMRPTVAQALDRANEASQQVAEVCRAMEVAPADIQTHQLTIQPHYDNRSGRNAVAGYEASNTVSVTFRDVSRVGELLSAAAEAAGDDIVIHGLQFSIEDTGGLLSAARAAAWADAQQRATQLSELANAELGPVLSVDETPGGGPIPRGRAVRMEAAFAADVPIEAGSESVSVTLTVTFSLA